MRVTILGCGGSIGVPGLGPDGWGACDPANPKNRRRRAAILIEHAGTALLVDTPPELHAQLLDADLRHLDAVFYTHAHADHLHGIDDLRQVNFLRDDLVPVYADAETLADIDRRFPYVFTPRAERAVRWYKPCLRPHAVDGGFSVGSLECATFEQDHGFSTTLGLRCGPFAYSTDVVQLDDAAFAALEGVDTWVVDCLMEEPHAAHSHLERTLDWIARVRPRRAVLTHMSIWLDYEALRAKCPPGVEPAYDGMVLEVRA